MSFDVFNKNVTIDREEVESQAFNSIGYDSDSETLELEFENKEVYRYYPVLWDVVENIRNGEYPFRLSKAHSVGKAFHEYIRKDKEINFLRMGNAE